MTIPNSCWVIIRMTISTMTEIFLSISFGSEGVTLYDNTDIVNHTNLVDSDLMTIAQCEISLQILRSQKSCQMKGNWVLKKRGVINLKIWEKMQLLFSIYEFDSKVGVKLEILKPNMMILDFVFLSYDCLNIWKNWFIKTLITFFILNLFPMSQHKNYLWKSIKNF